MSKKETLEEFLARGGTITKCSPGPTPDELHLTMPTPTGSATMMSLSEGSLYYSESRSKSKEKKKPIKAINFAALPASLLRFVPKTEN